MKSRSVVRSYRLSHPGERRWETNLLAVVTLLLTAFGLVNCYAAAAYLDRWAVEASQQVSGALIGAVAFLIAANLDYTIWKRAARPLFILTLAGLIPIAIAALLWQTAESAPAVIGRFIPWINGSRRWLDLGVRVQVSEGARFTMVAFLAALVAGYGEQRIRHLKDGFLPSMGVVALVVLLVGVEPSVSMAILLGFTGSMVVFTAGGRLLHFTFPLLVGGAGLAAILRFNPVRAGRYTTFLTPALTCDPLIDQACNSLIGIGNGGLFGVGFGQGTQKLGHLPYGYSDFILSAIGEEWGLLGIVFVATLFSLFCWVGFRIAKSASDAFGVYLATGLTASIAGAALLHGLVVLRMMPTTGLTLPFMSAGRLSLIVSLFSAGVIVSIGRARGRPVTRK